MKKKVPKGYTHNDEKEIFRLGEHVGTYHEEDGGKLSHPESVGLRFASPISNYVRAQGWTLPSPAGMKLDSFQSSEAEPETVTMDSGTEAIVIEAPEEPEPVAEETVEEIPPCPEKSIQMGNKTPEVVEWYQKYHPEEFIKRYAGKRLHFGTVQADGSVIPLPLKGKVKRNPIF